MTATDRELGGLVREWLGPGTTTLSEGVFTRAMAEVSTTPQSHGIPPLRRWLALPRTSRFALLGSTAIVIVAVVGIGLLLVGPGPSVGPIVATPPASPSPTAPPSGVPDQTQAAIDLGDGLRVTFEVPAGWSRYGVASVGTEDPKAPAGAEVSFYEADVVFKDPCSLDFFITQISGPTAADLVDTFEKTGNYRISRSRDVQLGGFTGKGIDLTAPKDVDACPSRGFMMFADGGRVASASSNQRDSLWILDVVDLRLVVDAVSFPGTPTDALVAQQRLLNSIRIERVGANPQPTATAVRRGTIDAIDGLAISFDIPEGWSKTGETAFGRSVDRYPPSPPDGVEVSFWEVDEVRQVRQHPCKLSGVVTGPATGTTPADLAAAFERVTEYDTTAPADTTLNGHRGKSLRITLPDQLGDCELPGRALLWESNAQPPRYGLPGELDTLWILDVEGIRLVVDATSFAQTSAADQTAQQQLVDSIRIERIQTPADPTPPASPSGRTGTWEAIDGLTITFDLPAGWSQPGGTGSSDNYPTPHVEGPDPGVAVNFYDDVETVFQNPCRSLDRLSGSTGSTPADLAAKLRSASGYSATEPVDVTLVGFRGKRLTLEIPESLIGCDPPGMNVSGSAQAPPPPGLMLWIGRPTGFGLPSQRDTLWILDVDGKRVVMEAVSFPGTSGEDLAAQQQLIDSIRIEPNAASAPPATEQGRIDSIDGLRITFDKPPGWDLSSAGASPTGQASTEVSVSFGLVERVWQRPCRMPYLSNNSLAGTTAAQLAAKFRSAQGYTTTRAVDVELAGYRGKRIQLQMPTSMTDCYLGEAAGFMVWIGSPTKGGVPDQRDDLRILDVDGIRLVIDAMSFPATTAEHLAAQQRLIDSIRIERVATEAHPLP